LSTPIGAYPLVTDKEHAVAQSLFEMATDLVHELINNHLLAPEDMRQEFDKTHAGLLDLKVYL